MTTLNLTGQGTAATQINQRILTLDARLTERMAVWNRMSPEKKKQWLDSNKDPIMSLAWSLFLRLEAIFKEIPHG